MLGKTARTVGDAWKLREGYSGLNHVDEFDVSRSMFAAKCAQVEGLDDRHQFGCLFALSWYPRTFWQTVQVCLLFSRTQILVNIAAGKDPRETQFVQSANTALGEFAKRRLCCFTRTSISGLPASLSPLKE